MSTPLPFGPDYGFGLYVHWPYCSKICPYCDFNVYTAKGRDSRSLVEAISRDLARHAEALPDHPQLGSVYFGGGTPSLLGAGDIALLIELAERSFGLAPDVEITLEANPNDVLAADLEAWSAAGVNRLSVGLQSLDDAALAFLGRDHDAANARLAADAALTTFDNVTLDLIYARPGQSAESWKAELTDALSLGAPHLSLYELTIEERTAFGKRAARGELIPMEDDDQADLYELTQEVAEAHGLPAYEVSNHARSSGTQSQHNLTYWRGGDWIGLGPGAHGRLTVDGQRVATHAALKPAEYIASVDTGLSPEPLSSLDTARELLALGLRPAEGFDLSRIEALIDARTDPETLATLKTNGLIRQTGTNVALTAEGRLLADRIAAELSP
ncbi:radical SAM family heme chaperone HemW [Henriciella pelagia]|uniref:Heme chaperone HemW n=1 Tax=Henriciella pelagia TaxID=1977912 RepID=A0ABQ1JZ38_9PROT|nr:radical SAM family heme chaperone HemW [Henriciella pelagia]GGB78865.1 coproporphyrinogen III oxidase [Henriciella pelagia]